MLQKAQNGQAVKIPTDDDDDDDDDEASKGLSEEGPTKPFHTVVANILKRRPQQLRWFCIMYKWSTHPSISFVHYFVCLFVYWKCCILSISFSLFFPISYYSLHFLSCSFLCRFPCERRSQITYVPICCCGSELAELRKQIEEELRASVSSAPPSVVTDFVLGCYGNQERTLFLCRWPRQNVRWKTWTRAGKTRWQRRGQHPAWVSLERLHPSPRPLSRDTNTAYPTIETSPLPGTL